MRENQRITASLKTAEYGLAYRLQSKRYNDIFQYPRAGSASTDSSGTWANRWFTSGFDSGGYGPNAAVKRCGVGCSRAFAKGSRLDSTQLLLCAYAPTSVGCGKGKNARISGANISYYRDKDYWGRENFRKDERKFSCLFCYTEKLFSLSALIKVRFKLNVFQDPAQSSRIYTCALFRWKSTVRQIGAGNCKSIL